MKYTCLMSLVLAFCLSGCTTLLTNEINRNREKNGDCDQPLKPNCIDLVEAVLADIVIATYVTNEMIEQKQRDQPLLKVDTGDIQCEKSEVKVCSVSLGCRCESLNAQEQTP